MSDDDFFGRPRGTTVVERRPVARTAPPRPRPAATRPAARSTGPARAPRPAPARRGPATRPPAARAPRPAPAARPTRPALPPLTGSQLRTRTLRRLIAFVVVIGLLVAAVALRLVIVQVADSGRYVAYGESQRDGFRALPAGRGAVYDRNGRAFAMSVAQPQVVADPSQVTDPAATAATLAELLGAEADVAQLRADLSTSTRYRVLAQELTDDQVAAVQAAVEDGALEGITIEHEYVRSRPNGELAYGVIGTALPEGQEDGEGNTGGISGIEREYDDLLRGRPGKLWYEQDVAGNPIVGGHRELDEARQGADLYLTLDQALQYDAEQALGEQVLATGAESAQAVIMRPSTGEILAMASVAVDDEGELSTTRDNKPVTDVFEPGSTNKMITVAGAIEEGLVRPDTVFDVPDSLQIYDREFTDSHPHPAAAWSVTDILVTSSNIGTIKIAQQLGKEKIDAYLRDFGFGETTGLGFPAEEDGIMRSVDEWSGVDIGSMPIGQGISVTALQMLSAYNVIANDGVYVAPRLLAATDEGSGQVPTSPSDGRRVISPETAAAMRVMLAKVVSDGTGELAAVPGYEAAGKTGTSWLAQDGGDEEDGYLGADGTRKYQASFVGLVNGADLSIIVSVRDPKTQVYGGDVAAPVFSHLAATALRRYQVPPPALLDATEHAVPELSASARSVDGEDVTGAPAPAAG